MEKVCTLTVCFLTEDVSSNKRMAFLLLIHIQSILQLSARSALKQC